MADIHIERVHGMSLAQARRSAQLWAEKARRKFDLQCSYEKGKSDQEADLLTFTRSGVSGTLTVTGELFELQARLGFMLGAFKDRIESEIVRSLDALIATHSSAHRSAQGQAPSNAYRCKDQVESAAVGEPCLADRRPG